MTEPPLDYLESRLRDATTWSGSSPQLWKRALATQMKSSYGTFGVIAFALVFAVLTPSWAFYEAGSNVVNLEAAWTIYSYDVDVPESVTTLPSGQMPKTRPTPAAMTSAIKRPVRFMRLIPALL